MTSPDYGTPIATVAMETYDAEPESFDIGPHWHLTAPATPEALQVSRNARTRLRTTRALKRAERAAHGPGGRPYTPLVDGGVDR